MYINHLTLSTGHLARIERGDVAGETLARVGPWLAVLATTGEPTPLPVSALTGYTAQASVQDGALVVTVAGAAPLVTLGVAKRSRHGAALWPLLSGPTLPPVHPGLQRPAEPWCGVIIWPALALDPQAAHWLGDLEHCIAWAWVTRANDDDI